MTPTAVARRAGLSRQWLYTFQEALEAIRAAPGGERARAIPLEQRASAASLQRRIDHRLRRRVEDL
jgi:hypothetical protein